MLNFLFKYPELRIRIRMDPELLPGSGSDIIVPEPDQQKIKEQINKYLFIIIGLVILDCVYCRTVPVL